MRGLARGLLLDGLTGALSFLVLAQGYRLVAGGGPSFVSLLAVALVVGVVAAALAGFARRRLPVKRRI